MRAPTRRDGAERREAILDAALKCFARRGVLDTGIEDIRKAARTSPSSIYHQFDGLPSIALALLMRTFERLFAHLARRVVGTRDARACVLALVDAHLEWVLRNEDEARVMYQLMSTGLAARHERALARHKELHLAPVAAHVGTFIRSGALPSWPPLLLDVVLLGPTHEACRRYLVGAPIDPEWMRSTLPTLAWRSISGALPLSAE
ncbi:MAG: TetR/AcrR family transcriptional regulator [Myxococcota bacterium]